MSTLDHCTDHLTAAARPSLTTRVVNNVAAFFRAWKNRREIYRLNEMSEFELADIGLRRTDIQAAASTPLGIDPTARLGAIVEARARREEAAARRVN